MKKTDKFDAAMAKQLNKKFDRERILPKAQNMVQSEILPKIKKEAEEGKNFTEFILGEKEKKNHEPTDPSDLEYERKCEVLGEFCVSLLSQLGFETNCQQKPWSSESEFGTQYSGWKMILKVKW